MKYFYTLLVIAFAVPTIAQVTYTKDIADIIYNKCTTCHRPGEIGPFSLTNYDEAASMAPTIKYVTASKYMPPWKADPEYQHYLDENYLTEDEIALIGEWVDNGAPYGVASEEPSLPEFPEGSAVGEPDLVLNFAESHLHKGNNRDEYRYFVLPSGLLEDKKIKAIELRPGNSKIVHHALFFQDTDGRAAMFDAMTPEYGFEGRSGFDTDEVLLFDQYPGFVPGQRSRYFPDGLAQTMNAGADLVIQMHYAPSPVDEADSSSVNIFFADETEVIEREIQDEIMLPSNIPGGFFSFVIPANQEKEFLGTWTLNQDLSFMGVFPHMHLLGKKWEVWLERPDGSKENLIKIDDWDFNWQGGFYFERFIVAPKGSKVRAKAIYDNTIANPNNPSNPPKTVIWGENTTDEMFYLPILYAEYKEGDEDIVFDGTTNTDDPIIDYNRNLSVFPNPASNGMVNIQFFLEQSKELQIQVYKIDGTLVRTLRDKAFYNSGVNYVQLNANSLDQGTYIVNIKGKDLLMNQKILITR